MTAWNPWDALRDRPEILFGLRNLPEPVAGVWHRAGRHRVIVVANRLDRVERNAVLAHELVHDERGGGPGFAGQPAAWEPVVARDEHRVDDEVARRLVPHDDLERLCDLADDFDGCVTARDVATALDVPERVARRALDLRAADLRRRSGRPRR